MYEESQRQLHVTMDQYGVAQRRLQALQAELDDLRSALEAVIHLTVQPNTQNTNCSMIFTGSAGQARCRTVG